MYWHTVHRPEAVPPVASGYIKHPEYWQFIKKPICVFGHGGDPDERKMNDIVMCSSEDAWCMGCMRSDIKAIIEAEKLGRTIKWGYVRYFWLRIKSMWFSRVQLMEGRMDEIMKTDPTIEGLITMLSLRRPHTTLGCDQ
ncbi:hypothetical protein FNV43_RR25886 [Rhamnella rubrinervis]|uniref:Sieve element occlusion C-terminal domain-containing protein n=1 Tax=Rhamnella rubrinervis TaxID=2594499 RepID=A0A8K0GNA1_9ROSA|nr:hypothetical protein FNV43_RR25886 [Rhamnella rubrinervis]